MNIVRLILAVSLVVVTTAQTQTVRVGTLHKGGIVVAFVRSKLFSETVMKPKLEEMDRAKKAGDTKKVEELNAWGQQHQTRVHEQLAVERPIDDIIAALAPAFPEIAKKAGVAIICADLAYAGPGVEQVDVTDQVLDWLQSDETTRKIVKEVRSQKGPVHVH